MVLAESDPGGALSENMLVLLLLGLRLRVEISPMMYSVLSPFCTKYKDWENMRTNRKKRTHVSALFFSDI